jgi:hypothetical protein
MNAIDKLLKMDAGKIKMPEKVVTLKLAKLGTEIEFPCVAIGNEKYAEIQEGAYELRKGDIKRINIAKMKNMTLIEGCPSIFKSKEVMDHFSCVTPKDLVNKLLLSGEMDDLYAAIIELNGYEQDEEDLKN